MLMKPSDVAWLAGLLEGEGCFSYQCSPGITVGMTDMDVVTRVSRMFGKDHIRGPYKYKHNRRPVYYTAVWGDPAVKIMNQVLPQMGERRSEKIRDILRRRLIAPGKAHALGTGRIPICHPGLPHYADGMCRSCYRKDRWKKGLPR